MPIEGRPKTRPRLEKGPALRPIRRLSGTDPLDPLLGTQTSFPIAPDDLGPQDEHHLAVDDDGKPRG